MVSLYAFKKTITASSKSDLADGLMKVTAWCYWSTRESEREREMLFSSASLSLKGTQEANQSVLFCRELQV